MEENLFSPLPIELFSVALDFPDGDNYPNYINTNPMIYSDKLYAEMHAALNVLNSESYSEIQKIKQSIPIVRMHIEKLNEFIKTYEFKSKEEEIRYFKKDRPMFSKELFYFIGLLEIESKKPITDHQSAREYYKNEINLLNHLLQKHSFLYQYYLLDEDDLDSSIFVRNPESISFMPLAESDIDNLIANAYSVKLSELQAIENLIIYLNANLESIDTGLLINTIDKKKTPRVFWKGTKAQFYELVYALVDSGSISGNIKDAMEWLGHCLNVKPSNFYGYHQSMRIRKKNRTPFLDLLKKFFLIHMDDNDENPRYA